MIIENLNINERISYLIEDQYDNNRKKFADSIGYSAQVVFNIVSGRKSKPSYDVLNAIVSTNSDINSEWLLTGKGEMLKSRTENSILTNFNKYNNYRQLSDAQVEIIEFRNEKISKLEKELSEMRYLQSNSITYSTVAESKPELITKKQKD